MNNVLNRKCCPLCGCPVVITDYSVGIQVPSDRAPSSAAWVCAGCGAAFSVDGDDREVDLFANSNKMQILGDRHDLF